MISCPYGNRLLSTFHVWVEYISVQKIRHSAHSNQWGLKCWKIPKTVPSSLGMVNPHLIHECLSRRPTHYAKRQLDRFTTSTQLRNKFPIGYNGTPQFHPKTAPSLRRSSPHLIHPFLHWPHSPSKRHLDPFSRFVTVYFPDRQTDRPTHRPTDRLGDRSVPWALTLTM